jgi:threonine dehydratase
MLKIEPTLTDIRGARKLTDTIVRNTPILTSEYFNELLDMQLYFKCENFQKTGSFKIRGASNAIFSLTKAESLQGVACQSSGNHGGAIACAAHLKGIHADIVMAKSVSKAKIHNVKTYNGNMIFCDTMGERDDLFLKTVEENNRISIHPYDNYDVIAGQGTIALEVVEQVPEFDSILVPIGGGGLISGISIDLEKVKTNIIYFKLDHSKIDSVTLINSMLKKNIKFFELGPNWFRLVTHAGISEEDIDHVLIQFKDLFSKI